MVSLLLWLGVYGAGRHPDVTWGDGIGYALAIRNGFDLSINANSHFLYLNFHRLVMQATGFQNSMEVLSWASVGWSVATLWVVYKIGELLKSRQVGLLALHLLAVCFPFWRHACIIEVYAMELFFWSLCVFGWVLWCQKDKASGVWILVIAHAVGLLIHIHFLLLFPALIFSSWKKKEFNPYWLLPYTVSAGVICFFVYVWKINTLQEVFFDSIQAQMTHITLSEIAKGLGLTLTLLVFLFPLGVAIVIRAWWAGKPGFMASYESPLFQSIGVLVLTLTGFCIPYPSAGIYVFHLPVFLIWAVASACMSADMGLLKTALPGKLVLILVVQLLFYFGVKSAADHFLSTRFLPDMEAKGGWSYYVYPWAYGNAPSLLEATRQGKVPVELDWNKQRADRWLRQDSLRP